MARSSSYRVSLRRRREGKTNYQARKAMVLSGRPRLVPRSTAKNIIVQIIVAQPNGDKILTAAHSNELKKFGWKAPKGNIPAAYLTGLLCGLKARAKGVEKAILDIGLVTPTKGSKVFAALRGALDAGMLVPHDEKKIVDNRNRGAHIAEYCEKLGSGSEAYSRRFSRYLEKKLPPEKLPEHFSKVKAEIIVSFNGVDNKQ